MMTIHRFAEGVKSVARAKQLKRQAMKKSIKKARKKSWLGWHMIHQSMQLAHLDGRSVKVGKPVSVKGRIRLCSNGLHAGTRPEIAVQYFGTKKESKARITL